MGCSNGKSKAATNKKEAEPTGTLLTPNPETAADAKPAEAPAADAKAEAPSETVDIEKMLGLWKTTAGEYSLEKVEGGKLSFKEVGEEPLTGVLAAVGSQYEGEIYKGSQLMGSLRITIEGDGLRSRFKPSDKTVFDTVGFLGAKAEPAAADAKPEVAAETAAKPEGAPEAAAVAIPMVAQEASPVAAPVEEVAIEESVVSSLWGCKCSA